MPASRKVIIVRIIGVSACLLVGASVGVVATHPLSVFHGSLVGAGAFVVTFGTLLCVDRLVFSRTVTSDTERNPLLASAIHAQSKPTEMQTPESRVAPSRGRSHTQSVMEQGTAVSAALLKHKAAGKRTLDEADSDDSDDYSTSSSSVTKPRVDASRRSSMSGSDFDTVDLATPQLRPGIPSRSPSP